MYSSRPPLRQMSSSPSESPPRGVKRDARVHVPALGDHLRHERVDVENVRRKVRRRRGGEVSSESASLGALPLRRSTAVKKRRRDVPIDDPSLPGVRDAGHTRNPFSRDFVFPARELESVFRTRSRAFSSRTKTTRRGRSRRPRTIPRTEPPETPSRAGWARARRAPTRRPSSSRARG